MNNDLLAEFRNIRKQVEEKPIVKATDKKSKNKQSFSRGYTNKPKSSDPYTRFKDKYDYLESTIDTFTTQDLMYYFREKALENGVRYVISNIKKDMAVFKKLQANYSIIEICIMIEFIFCSNQNYLDISRTQPTVLLSSWCNTIFIDSQLWVNDEYEPKTQKTTKKQSIKKREWQGDTTKEKVTIGDWN